MPRRSYYSKKSYSGPVAEKNYVLFNGAGIASGIQTTLEVADADNGLADASVKVASRIKAIFVSASLGVDVIGGADTFGVLMAKLPGGLQVSLSNPNGVLNNFTQQQTFLWLRMTPRSQNFAHQFIGWVKIPPRHQIMNEADTIVWSMSAGPSAYSHCSNFVYKHR